MRAGVACSGLLVDQGRYGQVAPVTLCAWSLRAWPLCSSCHLPPCFSWPLAVCALVGTRLLCALLPATAVFGGVWAKSDNDEGRGVFISGVFNQTD